MVGRKRLGDFWSNLEKIVRRIVEDLLKEVDRGIIGELLKTYGRC
jgi:hypothetical protein